MVVEQRIDAVTWLRKRLEEESPDLLREIVQMVAEALMSAAADAICGAAYGERSSGSTPATGAAGTATRSP